MRVVMRDARVTLIALLSVVALGLVSTVVSVAAAAARTSVLIMGGSGDPLTTDQDGLPFIRDYTTKVVTNFVTPSASRPGSGIPDGPYNAVAVITPAEFNSGHPSDNSLTFDRSVAAGTEKLDTCINSGEACDINEDIGSDRPAADDDLVVFGFSQSAAIATLEKARLAAKYPFGEGPDVSFILTANGNRPNGGFLARGPQGFTIPLGFPNGGVTFNGSTPTNTQYSTIDIAIQYDGWADQPINPANLLAVANANAGQRLLHPHYADHSLDEPGIIDQGQYGDTRYLMIPADTLPLLYELSQTPVVGSFLADVLDAPLRVLVESGYDRTSSPGEPKPWTLVPAKDPLKTAVDFVVAIPTGWDNAIENINGTRPFGTQRPGPFGVGGPDVDYLNPPADAVESTAETAEDTSSTSAATLVSLRKSLTESRIDPTADEVMAITEKATRQEHQTVDAPNDTTGDEPETAGTATSPDSTGSTQQASDPKSSTDAPGDSRTEAESTDTADTAAKRGPKQQGRAAGAKSGEVTSDPQKPSGDGNSSSSSHPASGAATASTDDSGGRHRASDSGAAASKPSSRATNSKPKHAAPDNGDRRTESAAAHRPAKRDTNATEKSDKSEKPEKSDKSASAAKS